MAGLKIDKEQAIKIVGSTETLENLVRLACEREDHVLGKLNDRVFLEVFLEYNCSDEVYVLEAINFKEIQKAIEDIRIREKVDFFPRLERED